MTAERALALPLATGTGGARVEIEEVERLAGDAGRLLGGSIDRPSKGDAWDGTTLRLAGWAVGTDVPAVAVDLVYEGRVLRKTSLAMHRDDVVARFEGREVRPRCGFRASISMSGLPSPCHLLVRVVFDDGGVQDLARIRARHTPIDSGYAPRRLPLGVTTLGRTGSTWMMRLLREHPDIVVHGGYPYETRAAAYWMHLVRVLSDSANPLQSSHPDGFPDDLWSIGHHPFNREGLADEPPLQTWFATEYPAELAALAQRSTDAFYGHVARGAGKPGADRFAEKLTPGHLPRLMWELYPEAGEVILVRDFRDMACSILAFNAKRGFVAFGRENVGSDAEFVETNLRVGARRLLASWREREDRAHLIRYEDLVLDPETALTGLFERVGLDADPNVVAATVARASGEESAMTRHRTSRDPRASIGRWRDELDPELAAVCNDAFRDAHEAFGYDLD